MLSFRDEGFAVHVNISQTKKIKKKKKGAFYHTDLAGPIHTGNKISDKICHKLLQKQSTFICRKTKYGNLSYPQGLAMS